MYYYGKFYGITKVKHMMNDSYEFLSLTAFQNKHNLRVPPLSFYGIISAINSLRKKSERTEASYESFFLKFLKNSKSSRLVYKRLVSKKKRTTNHKPGRMEQRSQSYTKAKYQLESSLCSLAYKCTKSSNIMVFNFKFLHRRLSTNSFLQKIGRTDTEMCSFCQNEKESLFHLFWKCSKTCFFWNSVFSWMQSCNIIDKENIYSSGRYLFGTETGCL